LKKQKQTEYRGYRTAGIRLSEELLPNIVGHSSQHEQPQLYTYHMFDKAHLVMLAEENLIPQKDAALMLANLREMETEGIEKVRLAVGGGMHSGEQYLIRKLSEDIGGRIHLGRSSGDLGKVGFRIKQRDNLLELMDAVNGFRRLLLKVAAKHVDTVMPGYTHGQHGQPLTFGHQMLAWAAALTRNFKRFESALDRLNLSPAGAAAMTGTNFPLNRHRTAELLGFEKPCENTLDATHSSDDILELFSVIAILHADLTRWADDIIFWTGSEVGMVTIPDRFCGTSSIMMQKKNAYAMGHIRGAAASTIGGLMTAFFVEKGATGLSGFSRNRYSQPVLLSAFDSLFRDLSWLTELVPALEVNKEIMRQRAGAFWAQATDVAGAIVRHKDLSWRTAHQIVGILVRLSHERGIKPSEVDTKLLDEAAVEYMGEPIGLSEEVIQKACDPVEFVKGRTLYGGPAPSESRRQIKIHKKTLKRDEEIVIRIRRQLSAASQKLEKAIDEIINTSGRDL
jgi:argininosuccinate lyase